MISRPVARISAPLSGGHIPAGIRPSDEVFLSGEVLTLRDMSLVKLMSRPSALNLKDAAVYFCAPTAIPKDGGHGRLKKNISCGPTTSERMAFGIAFLVRRGARIFIGKGPLPAAAALAVARAGGLYLTAVGGCGAYYSRFVKSVRAVAYGELGPEAVLKLELDSMPLKVVICGRKLGSRKWEVGSGK